ncbi:MAG: CDP-alcohol phosphatidyltransferase family protein [Polyangiaceae bacterium]|nr:CDP-alcohol phosphatidyltransferase family protein [Polyangiaceae bacterium]
MTTPVSFKATLKPGQVETPLDLYFFRPAAYLFVRLALPTPLSANGMTVLSIVSGLAGAVLFRFTDKRSIVIASALTLLYGILDCADGQLARARGTSSRLGRILDGMSDYIVGVTSGVTMSFHLYDTHGQKGALLAAFGLVSILLQGTLFDHFKNRYLTLSGSSYREGNDLAETRADIAQLKQKGGSPVTLLFFQIYEIFLIVQSTIGRQKKTERPSPQKAALYAKQLAPIARGWAYLGPSTHGLLLGIFACAGHLSTYVLVRLTLGNLLLVALFIAQSVRERQVETASD